MKKKKLNSLDKYVIFSISALIIFTIVTQIMELKMVMVSDTLITCFYSVFGGEVLTCALIKIFKLRSNDTKPDDEPKEPVG